MDLAQRAQAILLKPKEEWLKIKGESTAIPQLFTSYAMILAAIPAAAQFIGRLLFRSEVPFRHVLVWSFGRAFSNAVLSYVFSLAIVYLFALIIDALAPNFSSTRNLTNAMKLAVYSMTPVWLAGILYIIPGLGILVVLAGVYGLFLLYEGFQTPLMDTPKDKVLGFLVISIIIIAALLIVVRLILEVLILRGVA
jgi:hypothetical protein